MLNNAVFSELAGDNLFVWFAILGSVCVVGYLWMKFGKKSGRYKS